MKNGPEKSIEEHYADMFLRFEQKRISYILSDGQLYWDDDNLEGWLVSQMIEKMTSDEYRQMFVGELETAILKDSGSRQRASRIIEVALKRLALAYDSRESGQVSAAA